MYRPIIPPPLPRLISPGAALAATTIVTVLTGAAARPVHAHRPGPGAAPTEQVRYLLPLLPPRVPIQAVRVDWIPGAPKVGGIAVPGTGDGGGGDGGGGSGGASAQVIPASPKVSVPDFADSSIVGGPVYVESETDQPAARDPNSVAPAYPPTLEEEHVEGSVTVSFVVDTTGLADSTSMKVRLVTHPLFAQAVRAALPGMHFQPAQLAGRRVRQLVIQEFRFVLPKQAEVATSAARSRK
jgi:TonB family protein